ncbi:MAG TPA: DUF493 domain-containing protein [Anaerolineaceae bacterium]|nr:DUF493 domain-containing protein [Anaerolineaceae bacterium]
MTEPQHGYQFPCEISIKVIGDDLNDYLQFVIDTISEFSGELEKTSITTRKSGGDKYLSVTVPFVAQSRDQLETIYHSLNEDPRTRFII